jgi:hypothetical protein
MKNEHHLNTTYFEMLFLYQKYSNGQFCERAQYLFVDGAKIER